MKNQLNSSSLYYVLLPTKTVMHPDMHHGFSYLQIINIWHISPRL